MATIANLDVNLFARTKKFDSPIKKSGKAVKTFTSTARTNFGQFAGFFAPLTGLVAGAVGSFFAFRNVLRGINEQFTVIDQLAKFSREVGTTVNEMQALRLQAELTGTEITTLEKGTQIFTRRLGEAQNGIGAAVKGFDAIGLSADQLINLPLTEQLSLVSDKLNALPTPAAKAAQAYALFGRQGQELLTFFADGRDGINAAIADVKKFGGEISELDAANVEKMNDSFTRLDFAIDSVFRFLAIKAAPTITSIVNLTLSGLEKMVNVVNIFWSAWQIGSAFAVKGVADVLDSLAQLETAIGLFTGIQFDSGIKDFAIGFKVIASRLVAGVKAEIDSFKGFSGDLTASINRLKPSGDLQFGSQAASTAFLNDRRSRNQDFVVKAVNEGTKTTVDELILIRKALQRSNLLTVVGL